MKLLRLTVGAHRRSQQSGPTVRANSRCTKTEPTVGAYRRSQQSGHTDRANSRGLQTEPTVGAHRQSRIRLREFKSSEPIRKYSVSQHCMSLVQAKSRHRTIIPVRVIRAHDVGWGRVMGEMTRRRPVQRCLTQHSM